MTKTQEISALPTTLDFWEESFFDMHNREKEFHFVGLAFYPEGQPEEEIQAQYYMSFVIAYLLRDIEKSISWEYVFAEVDKHTKEAGLTYNIPDGIKQKIKTYIEALMFDKLDEIYTKGTWIIRMKQANVEDMSITWSSLTEDYSANLTKH